MTSADWVWLALVALGLATVVCCLAYAWLTRDRPPPRGKHHRH